MIPVNFLPPLPVETLKKQVRRARWRDTYKLAFGVVMLVGGVCGAWFMPYPSPTTPPAFNAPNINYKGYSTPGLSFYPDTFGNTSIGDASSDVVTIGDAASDAHTYTVNGNLRVNGTITTDSDTIYNDNVVITLPPGYKCKN